MEKGELDKIREESEEISRGIFELQEEIKRYKSGAEAFADAAEKLGGVTSRAEEMVQKIDGYVEAVNKAEWEKILDEMRTIFEEEKKIREEYVKLKKKISTEQRGVRKLEMEIKELKWELIEFREELKKEKNTKEKRGILKLFKKR